MVFALLILGRAGLRVGWRGLCPVWNEVWRILRISLPATGESVTNVLGHLCFLSLINRLGAVATAAHGVAIRCESIAFLTVTAFSVAASTLTGQYLGAQRPDLAARSARSAWAMGMVVLSSLGVVLYLQAGGLFWLFLGGRQPLVAATGIPVLQMVAFATPAMATIFVLSGALRGAGDTGWPMAFVIFGFVGVRLPLTLLLASPESEGGYGLGLIGAWAAMFADLYVRGALVAARFLHGGWRWTRV